MRPASTQPVTPSMAKRSKSLKNVPMTPKVSQKMRNMMARNMGMAKYLWVSTLSMATLRACSRLSPCFTTVSAHSFSIKL